jgi:hypothetical protein
MNPFRSFLASPRRPAVLELAVLFAVVSAVMMAGADALGARIVDAVLFALAVARAAGLV